MRSWSCFPSKAHEFNTLGFFGGVRVAHLYSFQCCVLVLFVFILCLVPLFSVSLESPPPPSFKSGVRVFRLVLLCIFAYLVPHYGVSYDFRIKTIFGSS